MKRNPLLTAVLGVVVVFLSVAFGWLLFTQPARAERARVEAVVLEYNQRLAAGYAAQDMSGLKGVATVDQAYTEYVHMASIGEGQRKLIADLRALRFLVVTVTDSTSAYARTNETWAYRHVSTLTGETSMTVPAVEYDLQYYLVKRSGAWLVDKVKAIEDSASIETSTQRPVGLWRGQTSGETTR
jgi:uncharacterized protein YgiM (DUF1202 family)